LTFDFRVSVLMGPAVSGMLVAANLGVAAAASPAWGTDSFAAAYDADAPVTVRGVPVEAKLVNPLDGRDN
jgi:hypothetical protein